MYKLQQNDNTWCVVDEFDAIVEAFDTYAQARDMMRDLLAHEQRMKFIGTEDAITTNPDVDAVNTPEPLIPVNVITKPDAINTLDDADKNILEIRETRVIKTKKDGKITNAERVREQVRLARVDGRTQEDIITWCMTNLGHNKQLAKSYVKAHWFCK